jgi:cytochrome c oxidase subunit 3
MLKLLNSKRSYQENMLIIAMVGMGVLFLILLLAYSLSKGTKGWFDFQLPKIFNFSTFIILISSYTLHQANLSFKNDDFVGYRYFLGSTIFLGLTFMVCQVIGWVHLQEKGLVFVKGKTSVAYVYVLTGLHVLHLLAGMIALLVLTWQALKKHQYIDSFVYSMNPPNQKRLKLVSMFWHFLDGLWLLLYLFFFLNH